MLSNNKIEEAKDYLNKAKSLDKNASSIQNNQAVVAAWEGNLSQAKNLYNKSATQKNKALLETYLYVSYERINISHLPVVRLQICEHEMYALWLNVKINLVYFNKCDKNILMNKKYLRPWYLQYK